MQVKRTRKKVVVVGAGLAGLTAAHELARDGAAEVTLLEARDRVGGRVLSRRVCGVDVDLGGFLIFPWYRRYRRLCAEVGLDASLRPVPGVDVFFDMGDRRPLHQSEFDLRLSNLVATALKSMASAVASGPLHHPKLDHFSRLSLSECIDGWVSDPKEGVKYKRLVDTLCQGYCYPPIDEYKAAFAVPIYPRTALLGDSRRSDMFRHGGDSLPAALLAGFSKRGGQLRLGCEVLGFDGRAVKTRDGEVSGDVFVFAQNADHPLIQDLIPRSRRPVRYTRFVTAVVRLAEPYQPEVKGWGAIFFSAKEEGEAQVLSMIDLERLYTTDALSSHYTVNIRLSAEASVDDQVITQAVQAVCSESNQVMEVVTYELWPQTMPASDEVFVQTVRALQGVGDCFFAGDYLGCPSMEVAVTTGQEVARLVQEKHWG